MDTIEEIEEVKTTPVDDVENADDYIVPPQPQEGEEETETPAESSEAETPDEVTVEETEPIVDDSKEPKPVEGETVIERARRMEIERLRRQNRELKKNSMFANKPEPVIIKKDDDLEEYDQADLEKFIKVANKVGLVRKEEVLSQKYDETAKEMLENFLETHKEYSAENDKDDLLWKQFQDRYSSGLYNQRPADPKQFKAIFERIHEDIFGSKKIESNAIAAKQEKIKSVSHSSGVANVQQQKTANVDPNLKSFFKGFDDEDLNELLS